jgi:hypothetical protein
MPLKLVVPPLFHRRKVTAGVTVDINGRSRRCRSVRVFGLTHSAHQQRLREKASGYAAWHRARLQCASKDVNTKGRRWPRADPPQAGSAGNVDGGQHSALDGTEPGRAGTALCMVLQRTLQPHNLAVGKQPEYRRRHAPGAFTFCIGT